jgi:flagellar biosynthesis/type III secretory pathway protein FliH
MAKLIKRGSSELGTEGLDRGLSGHSDLQRKPIIDRDTSEARSDAQQIRARAERRARELLAKAQAKAQQIIDGAQEQAERLKDEAIRNGYEEGRAQGMAELVEVSARSRQRMQQFEEQAEPQLTQLALTIARRILGRELELRPNAVAGLIKRALGDKARQRCDVFLRVNPEDLAVVREHKAELLEVLSRTTDIAIREDPNVARYGVIIETDAGTIDAQLETQLAVFERVLQGQPESE